MSRTLLINAEGPERRVAVLEDNALTELYVERAHGHHIVGNIYKGRVVRVLPGMQAAFVDIGIGRAAFLYAGDVLNLDSDDLSESAPLNDEEASAATGPSAGSEAPVPPIQSLVRQGQELVVQVSKEPIGSKGARVTSHISLPGRQLVLLPTVTHVGISRRIRSEAERERLREIVERIRPAQMGFIVRTVAEGQDEQQLVADKELLLRIWRDIEQKFDPAPAPSLVHQDLDLTLRTVRDLFTADVQRLLIDSSEEYERIKSFVATYLPHGVDALQHYDGEEPLFDKYGIEHEIERGLERKVWLKSGGYLVIDRGEALTSVDVNTGRFVGYHNLDDTILRTNLEAVKEVVTQLRLRNIGGIIVIDFIDMERVGDREKVWRALEAALQADRARTNALEISELGLVEMTRKRVRESLAEQLTEPCSYCAGRGFTKSALTTCYEILREIRRQGPGLPGNMIMVEAHPRVADLLADQERDLVTALEMRLSKEVVVNSAANFHLEQYTIDV